MFLFGFLFVCAAAVSHASIHDDVVRVRRAADSYVQLAIGNSDRRVKRQALSGRPCFGSCLGEFRVFLRNITGGELDLKAIQNGFFDKDQLFNSADILPEFCSMYKTTKGCIDECGEFEGSDQVTEQLIGLDYICIDHYDEFVEYQPCYQNLSKSAYDAECKEKCGGEDYVLEQVAKLESFGSKPDFGSLMNIMGNLCGFISCHLNCQRPHYLEECGSEQPADLLDEFIGKTIGGAMNQLSKLGLGQLVPQQCTALSDPNATPKPAVAFSTDKTDTNDELLKQKLNLEIKVLSKQYEKLELEIENLKVEKEVLEAQLVADES